MSINHVFLINYASHSYQGSIKPVVARSEKDDYMTTNMLAHPGGGGGSNLEAGLNPRDPYGWALLSL